MMPVVRWPAGGALAESALFQVRDLQLVFVWASGERRRLSPCTGYPFHSSAAAVENL